MSATTKTSNWLPILCRLGAHRWRAGLPTTLRGTYSCERCTKRRMGRVMYRPGRGEA
jgi:hypothetical protein